MRTTNVALAILLIIASVIGMQAHAGPITANEPVLTTGTVYRAIDGDTFIVNLDDAAAFQRFARQAQGHAKRLRYIDHRFSSIRVRLANVDTPESSHPDRSRNTHRGQQVSLEVKQLVEGERVQVRCHDWGDYGRSICNIGTRSVPDLGLYLIEQGHSPYITRWGRNPYLHTEYLGAAQSRR